MAPSTPPSTTPKPLVVNRPIPPERIILYFAALHKDNVQFPAPYKTMSELSGGKITPGALTTQFGEAKKLARELTEGKWEFTGTMTGPNSGKGKKRAADEADDSNEGAPASSKKAKTTQASVQQNSSNEKEKNEGSAKAKGKTTNSSKLTKKAGGDEKFLVPFIKPEMKDEDGADDTMI